MIYKGIVVSGKKFGREIGFPTANIAMSQAVEPGIWMGRVSFDDSSDLLAAIYVAPNSRLLEAHILDFQADIYGKEIAVELIEYIRAHKDFDDLGSLKLQIARDVAKVRRLHHSK
jgi:riboflavin kinase / FMN adenylyltransferase